jgi:hypothetical protein
MGPPNREEVDTLTNGPQITRRWKPRAARAKLQRAVYVMASLAAFAMAVGAGWRPK